jgi:hypothetical protein
LFLEGSCSKTFRKAVYYFTYSVITFKDSTVLYCFDLAWGIVQLAVLMFARWCQENCFKYIMESFGQATKGHEYFFTQTENKICSTKPSGGGFIRKTDGKTHLRKSNYKVSSGYLHYTGTKLTQSNRYCHCTANLYH